LFVEPERKEPLSDRERQIAHLASEGLTDKEIAKSLRLSVTTVRTYWNRMRRKLNAINRAQAIVRALDVHTDGAAALQAALRKVIDTSLLGVVVLDRTGRIIETNDSFLKTVGYGRTDVERGGLTWADVAARGSEDSDPGDTSSPCIRELRHRDGHLVYVICAALLFESVDGSAASYVIDLGRIPVCDAVAHASQSDR
jgi:PAS domain S-box-containing protein